MPNFDRNTAFWRSGIPLDSALQVFSTKDLLEEWNACKDRSALRAGREKMETLKGQDVGFQELLTSSLASFNEVNTPKVDVLKKMQNVVQNRLLQNTLVGFGFDKPRKISATPHYLTVDIWHGSIDWFSNRLRSQGLEIVEIRVLDLEMVEIVRSGFLGKKSEPEPVIQPAKGRPTIRPQIVLAYQKVLGLGIIGDGMSLKTISKHVRIQLAEDNPDIEVTENKPSFETIRRIISPLWKKTNKQ